MANEIWHSYQDGNTLYALIWRQTDDLIYDADAGGDNFEAYADASIGTYDIPLSEAGTTGDYYSVDFPSGISAGIYRVQVMLQAAGAPAVDTDTPVAQGEIYWSGSAEIAVEAMRGTDGVSLVIPDAAGIAATAITNAHTTTDALVTSEHVTTDALVTSEHVTTDALVTSEHVTTDALVTSSHVTTDALVTTVDGVVDNILVDTGTTIPNLIAALNDPTSAAIATAVWATAMSDLAAGAPSATASVLTAINYIYEAWRNKCVTDGVNNEIILYKDNGTDKLVESDITHAGEVFTKGEFGAAD